MREPRPSDGTIEPLARPEQDAETRYLAFVDENLSRNFLAHLLHGLLGQTGFRLVNAPTFLPAYVLMLSGSDFMVGLARAIQYLGMFLSPLLGASTIEHRKRVIPIGLVVGGLMRVQILGIALAGIFLPSDQAVVAICVFLGLFGFLLGMQGVIFNYLVSKVIPVSRRGRLLGLRNFLAGLTASGVAWLGGRYLIQDDAFGNGYAVTFILAFAMTTLGLSALLLVREPEPPQVRTPMPLRERLRELPQLLRDDRSFSVYVFARSLATIGRMGVPFYVLFAGDRIGLSGSNLGLLTAAFILAQAFSNLGWGYCADRFGFRLVLILGLSTWMGAVIGLAFAESLFGFTVVFFAVGSGMSGYMVAAQNLVLEFGQREDLPLRIALGTSAQEGVGALSLVAGGLIASLSSYSVVFALGIVFQMLAVILIVGFVDEPRRRAASP